MWRALSFAFTLLASCSAPVASRPEPKGDVIAFGGGSGGARDACFTCHGLAGEGDGRVPALAGLPVGYLVKQLEDYAGPWRDDPVMSEIARRLPDSERMAVSAYYSGLPRMAAGTSASPLASALFHKGDVARGMRPCSDCHGADGRGGFATPALAGQTAEYVQLQLEAWKQSRRRNDPQDVMGSIARKLSPKEIRDLANYVGSLP
jgi:cytochrome c553